MRTTTLRIVAALALLACNRPENPEATPPEPAPETPNGRVPAPGLAQTVEWDQELLDFFLVHMALTERLDNAIASRAEDDRLRALAEEERAAARQWRDELGAFRARTFPDAPPASLATAPTLTELGPTSRDQAARQGPAALDRTGGQDPRTTPPARGQLAEGGDPETANEPLAVQRGSSRRLPEGQEIDMGRPGEVDVAEAPAASTPEEDAQLLASIEARIGQLEAGPVDVRTAVDVLAPMHRRALAAATIGARGAAHPELRDLALRIQQAEQRSLERLRQLAEDDRG